MHVADGRPLELRVPVLLGSRPARPDTHQPSPAFHRLDYLTPPPAQPLSLDLRRLKTQDTGRTLGNTVII